MQSIPSSSVSGRSEPYDNEQAGTSAIPARTQNLDTLAVRDQPSDEPHFEGVSCIAGRGIGVRREDMKKSLLTTRGKVFTLQKMFQLVKRTRLAEFRSCSPI